VTEFTAARSSKALQKREKEWVHQQRSRERTRSKRVLQLTFEILLVDEELQRHLDEVAVDLSERLLDFSERHVLRSDVSSLDSLRDVVLFVRQIKRIVSLRRRDEAS